VINKQRLNAAFADLRASGYIAEQNFQCCMTCGIAEANVLNDKRMIRNGSRSAQGFVFYHSQDKERMDDGGHLMLAFGAFETPGRFGKMSDEGVGADVVRILRENDLHVRWNGSADQRIEVLAVRATAAELLDDARRVLEQMSEFWENGTPVHAGSGVANDALVLLEQIKNGCDSRLSEARRLGTLLEALREAASYIPNDGARDRELRAKVSAALALPAEGS
jgi:hypothetical protein